MVRDTMMPPPSMLGLRFRRSKVEKARDVGNVVFGKEFECV